MMQLIGAYVMFLLSIFALGLGVVVCWAIGEVVFGGAALMFRAGSFRSGSANQEDEPVKVRRNS
jgi:hypothetical protein